MSEKNPFEVKSEQQVVQQEEQISDVWTPPQSPLRTEPLSEEEQRLTGLGGWLILVGIGVIVKPISILLFMVMNHLPPVMSGDLAKLTTEGMDGYIPYMGVLFWGEVLINALLVCAWVVTAVLFFRRKKLFTKWFISLAILNPIIVFLDLVAVSYIVSGPLFDPEDLSELIKVIVYAAVWVPYMLISKRVRLTFVH